MSSWNSYLARGVFEPAFGASSVETAAEFHPDMYPHGVNADFMAESDSAAATVVSCFQGKFEGEHRDIAKAKVNVIQLLLSQGLAPGGRVLDVGAGTGLFLKPVSDAVGTAGVVHAAEVSQAFTDHLKDLVSKEKLSNVTVELVPSNLDSYASVPDASVDLAIIVDVYHHFEFPKTTMRAIRKALKPDVGKVVVIDFIRDPVLHKSHPYPWIMHHVRAGQEKIRREILSCGFGLLEEPVVPGLDENYTMVFGAIATNPPSDIYLE